MTASSAASFCSSLNLNPFFFFPLRVFGENILNEQKQSGWADVKPSGRLLNADASKID